MGEIPRTSDVSRPQEISSVVDATPLDDVSRREENKLRVKMLDQIVTCLEMKKPSWQKARILHLSTQLEDSMFNSKESLAEYGDVSTLPAKINHHCLLLATRKTTTSRAPAPGTAAGVCSFAATPVSRGTPIYRSTHVKIPVGGFSSGLGRSSSGRSSSSFALVPPSGLGGFSQPAPQDPATGETAAASSVWIGAGHKLGGGAGGGGWGSVGYDGAGGGRRISRGVSDGDSITVYSTLLPRASSFVTSSPMATAVVDGSCADAPHSSSHGETTEDDMNDNDDSVDGDGDGDGDGDKYDERHKAPKAAAIAPVPPSAPLVQQEQAGGDGPEEDDEEEVTEQAHVEAVIAAASASLGEETAWNGGVQTGVRQLLEGVHQPQTQQQHPKATEAEVRQHALRLLECRLLLLTHASTCSKEDGSCQLAPLCDSVRQLLQHMQSCRDEKTCEFPHCKSSKAVLQHKRLCTDSTCRLCCSVKDLSQRCFWANARHLHKRRLEESHELRRKKRQSEGKAVAPPRKLQAEKTKGKECCSGLDEAGNDLGDISLGFFLRQANAVKARKIGKAQKNGGGHGTTSSADSTSTAAAPVEAHADSITPSSAGSKRSHDGVPKGGGSPAPQETGSSPPTGGRTQPQTRQEAAQMPSSLGLGSAAPACPPALPSPASSPRLRRSTSSSVSWSALLTQQVPSRGGRSPRAQDLAMEMHAPVAEGAGKAKAVAVDAEDVSGGGPEASSVSDSSGGNDDGCGGGQHSGKKAAQRAGGLTVVIPPVGSGAVVGHLRSPSEIMLDDIAESLADTTRKPSFARMQSVQAFLDDHVELRASASFGDVSAMVEHWMSLEDNNDADNFEDENGMDAFSF